MSQISKPPQLEQKMAWIASLSANPAWATIDGALASISIADDGAIWGTNSAGNIYRRRSVAAPWEGVPGAAIQVDAQSFDSAVCTNASEDVYQFVGGNWQPLQGKAIWVSIGSDGTVWAVNAGCVGPFSPPLCAPPSPPKSPPP